MRGACLRRRVAVAKGNNKVLGVADPFGITKMCCKQHNSNDFHLEKKKIERLVGRGKGRRRRRRRKESFVYFCLSGARKGRGF